MRPEYDPYASSLAESAIVAPDSHLTSEQQSMNLPLAAILKRAPVSCSPSTSIRAALETMNKLAIGSIIVIGDRQEPRGIVTLREVLERVALAERDLSQPVEQIMSTELKTLPSHAPAYEAALLMTRHGIAHIPVVEDGRLVGVVSESLLFSLQNAGLRQIRRGIESAASIEDLSALSEYTREAVHPMLEQGASADHVARFISTMSDLLTQRAIELEFTHPLPGGIEFCWISMGSEGRLEQTLSSDQDNGIIFEGEGSAEHWRQLLTPMARAVNEALARCGFPLCRGNIMASNPQWCLNLDEWKGKFADWINNAHPEALLNATIFFDFRPLHGETDLAVELRRWLADHVFGHNRFLLQMTQNALENQPPLGLVRDFILTSGGEHPHTLDLKVNGITPFVDAARVYSLATGVTHTNTLSRLRLAGQQLKVAPAEVEAWIEGFSFIQLLRLRRQDLQRQRGEKPHNHLDPDELNEMERRMLKEAMRQARKLQSRLARDYSVGSVSFGA
ncbi:MAG TPA: putative nucleotidyltransferase substrate binding domain-containing protein [Burkholderiales bacterium]|nr:putative nucleotidyltransferase substrate binding domain-containing protein [Burkholderiales bacterium]